MDQFKFNAAKMVRSYEIVKDSKIMQSSLSSADADDDVVFIIHVVSLQVK